METSVYKVNKGINKAIEFKGLKAQYIWHLGAGLVGLLILFAALYISGINSFICVAIALILGTILVLHVFKLSHKYGQYGLMKKKARRLIPGIMKARSRKVFINLKKN